MSLTLLTYPMRASSPRSWVGYVDTKNYLNFGNLIDDATHTSILIYA